MAGAQLHRMQGGNKKRLTQSLREEEKEGGWVGRLARGQLRTLSFKMRYKKVKMKVPEQ